MRTCLLLALMLAADACGGQDISPGDLTGTWHVTLTRGNATLELVEKSDADLAGTFSIDDALWSVTGTAQTRPRFKFYILPAQNELLLFDTIGLVPGGATAKAVSPAHAADRLTFDALLDSTGSRATGRVSGALQPESEPFSMQR